MKKQKKYSGIVIPMLTPFTKDGRIDLEAVEKIIDNFISYQVYPFILGTTGEAASISSREKIRIAEYIGKNGFYIGCHQYLEREDLEFIVNTFKKVLK